MRRTTHPLRGPLLVVGGQARSVGKTALVVDLIRAVPKARWTAVKITPYTESGCPVAGSSCRCGVHRHTFAIREEFDRVGVSDTSRFLAAGAVRAFWLQTKKYQLVDGLGPLGQALADATNVVIESDSIVKFWVPEMFILVLDPSKEDFKPSARKVLQRADCFVLRSPTDSGRRVSLVAGKAAFLQPLGKPLPADLQRLVRQRFRTG